ncbi:MAG: phenylalanine--tRNA ligase subunit beta [Armatimonadota bacterium]
MRVPYHWLCQYLETDLSADELARRLTMAGLEVESIEDFQGQPVLVAKVTANRGDLLSMVGVARDAAAVLRTRFAGPRVRLTEHGRDIGQEISIEIRNEDLCPRYSARLIRGVTVAESPDWLKVKLEAAGLRPINNVVDATNFVLWELGQPLHAFDYDLLRGKTIVVRTARPGERLVTIDGEERLLGLEDLVIADAEAPVALAGVMGGADTEVTQHTRNVLIESAHFDPASVRLTALRHAMSTEASYRFERFVDPSGTVAAADRVCQIIADIAGGEVAEGVADVYPSPVTPRTIALRPERANAILGTQISAAEMVDILRRLGMTVEEGDRIRVTVPTFRSDVEREIDLIEEIARVYGYDRVPFTLHPSRVCQEGRSREQRLRNLARDVLLQCGLTEALTFSMIGPRDLDRIGLPPDDPLRDAVRLASPASEDLSIMRTTLIPSALRVAEVNVRRRLLDLAFFEIGKVFLPVEGRELPDEQWRVVAFAMGANMTSTWNLSQAVTQIDFFWLKGILEQLVAGLGIANVRVEPSEHPTFARGRCAAVRCPDGAELGVIGEVAPSVRGEYDVPRAAYLFELNLERMISLADPLKRYRPISPFPSNRRDIALLVDDDEQHSCAALEEAIRAAAGDLLESVRVFDLFVDEQRLGKGKKSVAFTVEFRAPDRTVPDEEVDEIMDRIAAHLSSTLGARVRGRGTDLSEVSP